MSFRGLFIVARVDVLACELDNLSSIACLIFT